MTPQDLDLVAQSAERLDEAAGPFAEAFYGRLFEIEPEVRSLFPADLTEQKAKLVDELSFLASAASDLDRFLIEARELGARHVEYGVVPRFYDILADALLHALAVTLGDHWTPELAAAWTSLYQLIAQAMLDGASSKLFS